HDALPISAGEAQLQVQLVDTPHQGQILRGCRLGQVVHAAAADAHGLNLLGYRQRMDPVDHRFALSNPALPSAPSKKSFSSVSSPILACSVFRSTVGSTVAPLSNTPAAPDSSCSFHCEIWFGWTSKRLASSASVCSPFRAAKATLDLKAGEWFRRVRRVMICSWLGDIIAVMSRQSTYRAVQISGASSVGQGVGLGTRWQTAEKGSGTFSRGLYRRGSLGDHSRLARSAAS